MRIGSVPYLNARPLVDWFERHPHPGVTLTYAPPAELIGQLHAGELDIIMASTFAVLEDPTLSLLPGLGVTSAGPAWSVRLLSRVPLTQIRALALDVASRSTTALARIILADCHGAQPLTFRCQADVPEMLARAEAAVVIGDVGLSAPAPPGIIDVDLGQAWYDLTGLPFYFAGWMARDGEALASAAPLLTEACAQGLARLEKIARHGAACLGLPYARCLRYLQDVLCYHADADALAGLAEFRCRATRLGMLAVPTH